MTVLTVLVGLPGAGKSTWAARHPERGAVLTADAIRLDGADPSMVFARMHARAAAMLARGESVVVDPCSLQRGSRLEWKRVAERAGARAELVVVDAPFHVCRRRDAARERRALIDWARSSREYQRARVEVSRESWDRIEWVRGA